MLIRFFTLLLILQLNVVQAFAYGDMRFAGTKTIFHQIENLHNAQTDDVGFALRALRVFKRSSDGLNFDAPNRTATYRIGDADGGPGAWTRANESMSDAQRAYQQRVTGAPDGTTYNVPDSNVTSGRTSFDGYNPQTNALIDAKCWTCWPNNSLSFSNQSVVDQAFRQQRIAQQTGRTVEWHVPDQAAATRVQNAFATASQSQRIDPNVVRVVVTPQ